MTTLYFIFIYFHNAMGEYLPMADAVENIELELFLDSILQITFLGVY